MKIRRVVAAVLVIIIFMCSSAGAAWDGYPETGTSTVSVIDFNSFSSILKSGAIPETRNTADGKAFSAHWTNHTASGDIYISSLPSNVPSDWSEFKQIQLKIYSEKATGASIMLVIYCPNNAEGVPYFNYTFKLNWEGWNTVKINLTDFAVVRSASWKDILSIRFVAHGNWSLIGNPESDIYIAGFDLKAGGDKYSFVGSFYEEETVEKTYDDLKDSVAVYAGGDKAVTSEGVQKIEYAAEMSGKSIMVPVQMFSEYLGAVTEEDGDNYSVSLNGAVVSGKSGEKAASVCNYESEWSESTYVKDGRIYVPGEEMANALGLCAFSDGKLLVMGTQETYDALHRGENLGVNEEK